MSNPTEVLDDEMPAAPAVEDGSNEVAEGELAISGEMDADIVEKAVEGGEPIPAGTYLFKLESYEKRGKPNDDGLGPDPNYNIKWVCLDPKFAKRVCYDTVTWVREADLAAARAGDPTAVDKCSRRLGKIKQLQKAAGFKPQGRYNVMTDFLDKQPEVKLKLTVKQRMHRNEATGKYDVPTGKFDNNVDGYFPAMRTA